jgi:transposase-like protein
MEKRQVTNYTEEFKRSSAKLAVESDQPITATARNLGVNEVTLHGWVKRYYATPTALTGAGNAVDMLAELTRLKKEVTRLKMERDILKKAAAYFANDSL